MKNSPLQIDFNFIPKINTEFNYNNEFNNNQIIDFSKKSSFSQYLEKKELSFHEKILQLETPDTGHFYQYKGGQISILMAPPLLSKSDLSPKGPTQSNNIKISIRFRRFFKANRLHSLRAVINSEDIEVDLISFPKKKGHHHNFITADIFKSLNISNRSLTPTEIEIHFGKIFSNTHSEISPLPSFIKNKEEEIATGDLFLEGRIKDAYSSHDFKSKIKKLVFNLKKRKLTNKPIILTTIKESHLSHDQKMIKKELIKRKLLDHYQSFFIKHLRMTDLYKGIGQ